MNRALWLRFLGISVFFALILSALYMLLIREVAGAASGEVQRSIYLFIARVVEEQPYAESIKRVERFRSESPAMSMELWVVSGAGEVLAGSTGDDPPAALRRLAKPLRIHDVASRGRFFSGGPAFAIVRLDAADPTYLMVRNSGIPRRHIFILLAIFFVVTLVSAMVIGLLLVTLYLRGRSRQARQVIAQIESGDLAARFNTDRLDAVGGLMLNFNRMADEIQRLVARLQTTERARRELLQELGHDLRTPLTSLRTAIETLATHGNAMPAPERQEFFGVIASEFGYFGKLIDDLFFIAEIDEPRYRKNAERIDLGTLVTTEMQSMQGGRTAADGAARGIRFELCDDSCLPQARTIICDPHLVARLFRNVFDNAARYARSTVRITITPKGNVVDVAVEDDGPGMLPEAMALFGQRRTRRLLAGDAAASLGLGSVIVKTIIELHGGYFKLQSHATDPAIGGTRMTISFPADRQSQTNSARVR